MEERENRREKKKAQPKMKQLKIMTSGKMNHYDYMNGWRKKYYKQILRVCKDKNIC